MIYFIKQQSSLAIRIGIAANIEDRLQQLQAGSSKKLITLKSIKTENDYQLRQLLHVNFKSLRLKNSHWFTLTPVITIFLDKLENNKFYHTSKIEYLLSVAEKSVNRFKIKVDSIKIKEKINALSFNQSLLAKKIGCSRALISLVLIKQQTSLFTIRKIAKALECPLEDLTIDDYRTL